MLMYMLELVKQHLNQQRIGGVAHMVERSLRMREARGSIPRTSIIFFFILLDGFPGFPLTHIQTALASKLHFGMCSVLVRQHLCFFSIAYHLH